MVVFQKDTVFGHFFSQVCGEGVGLIFENELYVW